MIVSDKQKYYSERIKQIKCAYSQGRRILAKPFLILAIIELIEDGICKGNKFEWEKGLYNDLIDAYKNQHFRFQPNNYLTPLYKPFYHLSNDGFWHLSLKDNGKHHKISSNKSLRELDAYGYLDEALWDLLQDATVREDFKELIINFFIRKKTN